MNPGLVVKLRPTGPWRIGPDSGARNRVDVIYHSDSLYGAVTSAMSRMDLLEEWLEATARSQTPAVSFSSCFPLVDDIAFVVPPRTMWPPMTPQAMSARVRWKSARFIPLSLVESMLAGKRLNDNQWSVDGASGCLVPAGKRGPFRTSVRWNAAVDRLSGASERHATACIEFREGCGLWTVVGFRDDKARDGWQACVKAAFRLLADTGFGGERSRGWGRSEMPEFVEGTLPGLILEYRRREPRADTATAEPAPEAVEPVTEPDSPVALEGQSAGPETEPVAALSPEGEGLDALAPGEETPAEAVLDAAEVATDVPEIPAETPPEGIAEVAPVVEAAEVGAELPVTPVEAPAEAAVEATPAVEVVDDAAETPAISVELAPAVEAADAVAETPAVAPATEPVPETAESAEAGVRAPGQTQPMRVVPERDAALSITTPVSHLPAHWLLSLYTPAAGDTVDWGRGSYTVIARGGRVDSPAGSGELKKQIQMVAEGSVLCADGTPLGAAPDVAPDGFAHPVFRSGFALTIPLPEVH